MTERSSKLFTPLKVEDTIILNISKFDRGPLDPKNIEGIVLDVRNNVYQIGTPAGVIKNWCSREELKQVEAIKFEISQVPRDKLVSVREAVSGVSLFEGQGFVKCNCQASKNQCATKRCSCFKNQRKCSSKCHQPISCSNK